MPPLANMDDAALDALILARADLHWHKVALLIARVSSDERFPASDKLDDMEVISGRIRQLIADGRIEVRGDVTEWRFSEVRIAY